MRWWCSTGGVWRLTSGQCSHTGWVVGVGILKGRRRGEGGGEVREEEREKEEREEEEREEERRVKRRKREKCRPPREHCSYMYINMS